MRAPLLTSTMSAGTPGCGVSDGSCICARAAELADQANIFIILYVFFFVLLRCFYLLLFFFCMLSFCVLFVFLILSGLPIRGTTLGRKQQLLKNEGMGTERKSWAPRQRGAGTMPGAALTVWRRTSVVWLPPGRHGSGVHAGSAGQTASLLSWFCFHDRY